MLPDGLTHASSTAALKSEPGREGRFGLTSPQMAIWLDQALHPQMPIYNTGQTLTISATLDLSRFAAAVRIVISESDALRLRFTQKGATIAQEIVDDVEHGLEVRDFTSLRDPEEGAKEWLERTFWRPLTPADFPLFRFAIAKVAVDRYIWMQKYHHLIIDATGRQIVASRVAAIYNRLSRGEDFLPVAKSSYRAAKQAEDAYFESGQYQEDTAYWTQRFRDVPASLVKMDAAASEKLNSGRPTRLQLSLADQPWERLCAFARERKSSPFKIICALAWLCFSRLYDNPEPILGVALANRIGPEAKRTVGLFSKVMPFRLKIDPAIPVAAALIALDIQLGGDLKHQRFPTDHLHRDLQLRRLGRTGLFDAVINYVRNDYEFEVGGAPITCTNLSSGFASPWSIMALEYSSRALTLIVDYDQGRVSSDKAEGLLHSLQRLLIAIPDAADAPIGTLQLAGDGDFVPSSKSARPQARTTAAASSAKDSVPDDLEHAVRQVWREIFPDDPIELDANFFDLGGNSLKAVFVVGECNARFATDLPLTVLFEHPTIAELVDAIRGASDGAASRLIQLKPGGNNLPLILIHPVGGSVFCYHELASRLPDDIPVYGIQAAGLRLGEPLPDSIEEMAADYVRLASPQIRNGPWHLAGWSFGGLIAFEMALQLSELRHPAASLTLMDTPARSALSGEDDEQAVLIAVAGALGIDISLGAADDAQLSFADLIAAVTSRTAIPTVSEEQIERMATLVRNFRRLRRKYRPRRFSGAMLLLRAAAGSTESKDTFDWSAFGDVTTVALPATHHSLVFPPHVDNVVTIFTDVLRAKPSGGVA